MTMRKRWTMHLAAAALALTGAAGAANAQTGSALVLLPWADAERTLEAEASGLLLHGHSQRADHDLRLGVYEADGRYRFDAADRDTPSLGASVMHLDLGSDDPALPQRLTDVSVALGARLGSTDDWTFHGVIGGGFAGDLPFADRRAWYGQASLLAVREMDARTTLTVGLDYDGNRTIFPDLPLPGVAFTQRLNDQWVYTLGLPVSAVYWTPDDRWRASLIYGLGSRLDARVAYALTGQWSLFGALESRTHAFHLNDDDRHRRLFFEQRRVEAGVRWVPGERLGVTVAGGYAFGQRFSYGFDTRDTDTLRRISDEPYMRVALELAF